jgi:carbamoyltransferase
MDLAVYGYHDGSVCVKDDGKYYIYEAERFFGRRYSLITREFAQEENVEFLTPTEEEFEEFFSYIKNYHNIDCVENFFYHDIYSNDINKIQSYFKINNFKSFDHHYSHACSAYYQSSFDNCYIISYDGSGKNTNHTMSSFVFWHANNNEITKLCEFTPYNAFSLGDCYIDLSICLSSINGSEFFGLPRAGKLMGLCAHGKPREEWKVPIAKYFDNPGYLSLNSLANEIGLYVQHWKTLSGQDELDFAATIQWAFEDKFFRLFNLMKIPKGSNICLVGGCAMNIVINQKLFEMGYNVYVPPNVGDCGLTFGVLADLHKDKNIDLTYAGYEILDKDYRDESFDCKSITNQIIAKMLFKEKNIIGFIQGRSECGPRALGNRSILCYPDIQDLKNKLNSEIKFREWFRPFGAVTKLECLSKYCENACESRHMTFCPVMKENYRWPSVTHVDNTCRIQTVTSDQNSKLYNILDEIEKLGGEPILLNTSLNIKGKPILTTLKDAFEVLKQTKLNGFVYEDLYFKNNIKL